MMKFKSATVVGLGHVGLPTAVLLVLNGARVHGCDIDPRKVQSTLAGDARGMGAELTAVLRTALDSGRLTASTTPQAADVHLIAVPTPLQLNPGANPTADLSCVMAAAASLAPVLSPGCLVLLESTSPPGTTTALGAFLLKETGLAAGKDYALAYAPERVLPGTDLMRELRENSRICGGITTQCAQTAADFYRNFCTGEIHLTDAITAETVKLMENAYRDVNIAFANEMSLICEAIGVDTQRALQMANSHPRVKILKPGVGVGGHCVPVDPWFLVQAAPHRSSLLAAARAVNTGKTAHVAHQILLAAQKIGANKPGDVLLLGLAYKPDVCDFRESPGVEIARSLLQALPDAVVAHDACLLPEAALPPEWPAGLPRAIDLTVALEQAKVIAILTEHSAYASLRSRIDVAAQMCVLSF